MDEINIASGEDFAIGVLLPGSSIGGIGHPSMEGMPGLFQGVFGVSRRPIFTGFFPTLGTQKPNENGVFLAGFCSVFDHLAQGINSV